jgi:hypothetical protein
MMGMVENSLVAPSAFLTFPVKAAVQPLGKKLVPLQYSKTCEIRTPLGRAKSVPNSEVSSFQGAICTVKSSLGPDEVSLFHRMSSFRRVSIHRFHCMRSFICLWPSYSLAWSCKEVGIAWGLLTEHYTMLIVLDPVICHVLNTYLFYGTTLKFPV